MSTQPETDLATGMKLCPACGIAISCYVNKCPSCGQHTQRSHADHARRRNGMQFALMMLAAVAVFVVLLIVVMSAE